MSLFVSHQLPDQYLPSHPLHRREQFLCPVSLPERWDEVECDPGSGQPSPHGLLQVGQHQLAVSTELCEMRASWPRSHPILEDAAVPGAKPRPQPSSCHRSYPTALEPSTFDLLRFH